MDTFEFALVWQPLAGRPLCIAPLREEGRGKDESREEWYARCVGGLKARGQMADDAEWSVVPMAAFPVDALGQWNRRFRHCWRAERGTVAVDIPLARAQVLAEVRTERNARLDVTDKDVARLADIGTREQQAKLKVHRQALRDLPATVEAEIAALDVTALDRYAPIWPAKE